MATKMAAMMIRVTGTARYASREPPVSLAEKMSGPTISNSVSKSMDAICADVDNTPR